MGNCIEMDSLTLPEVENANVGSLNLLPERSKMLYQKTYDESVAWCAGKLVVRYSEFVVLASFSEISQRGSIARLWPKYYMLRSTLCIRHELDISN